jgi:hypothetical protein
MGALSKEAVALSPLASLYSTLVNRLLPVLGEKWTFAALVTLYHDAFIFIPLNALLFLIDRKGWFERWRIQKGKYPPNDLIRRAAKDLAVSHLLVNPLLAGLVLYPVFKDRMPTLADSVKVIGSHGPSQADSNLINRSFQA